MRYMGSDIRLPRNFGSLKVQPRQVFSPRGEIKTKACGGGGGEKEIIFFIVFITGIWQALKYWSVLIVHVWSRTIQPREPFFSSRLFQPCLFLVIMKLSYTVLITGPSKLDRICSDCQQISRVSGSGDILLIMFCLRSFQLEIPGIESWDPSECKTGTFSLSYVPWVTFLQLQLIS